MFVQATKSTRSHKTYLTYLVRQSFRTPKGPRSRTLCNITALPLALMKTDPALLTETDPPSEKGFFLSKEKASEERGSVVVSAKAERNGV